MLHPSDISERVVVALPVSVEDRSGQDFESAVMRALMAKPHELLLDCSDLGVVYSGHIRLMWIARDLSAKRGSTLRLVGVRPELIRVLRLLDLEAFFPFKVSDTTAGYADTIPVADTSIREALERFERYLGQLPMPELAAMDIRTIFYEMASNIMYHGELDSNDVIVVTAVVSTSENRHSISLKFIDSGVPFDPTVRRAGVMPHEAAESRRTRGYGLTMIAKLADSVSYERHLGVLNVCTAVKQWST